MRVWGRPLRILLYEGSADRACDLSPVPVSVDIFGAA